MFFAEYDFSSRRDFAYFYWRLNWIISEVGRSGLNRGKQSQRLKFTFGINTSTDRTTG